MNTFIIYEYYFFHLYNIISESWLYDLLRFREHTEESESTRFIRQQTGRGSIRRPAPTKSSLLRRKVLLKTYRLRKFSEYIFLHNKTNTKYKTNII